jgi:hypothetical protein
MRVTQPFDFAQGREPVERQMGVFRQPHTDTYQRCRFDRPLYVETRFCVKEAMDKIERQSSELCLSGGTSFEAPRISVRGIMAKESNTRGFNYWRAS